MDEINLCFCFFPKSLYLNNLDLVKFVGETVKAENASSPNKPIYLVGDSFGGCLALAVGACNPTIDLVVILVNPGESVEQIKNLCILISYYTSLVL